MASTGVYCRPSCAARRPHRENVRFFASAAAAERAGFRPCKRCKPDQASLKQRQAEKVAAACRLIETAEEEPTLDALADAVGVSPYHFHRLFKAATGVTPKAYASAHRRSRVRDRLGNSGTVTEAIYAAGFNSNGRFYAGAAEALGMTPTDFRQGGRNQTLRYAIGACSLGHVLVAASDKGVAAIFFGDDDDSLLADLRAQFPRARLIGGDTDFEQLVAEVVALVEDPKKVSTCRSMSAARHSSIASGTRFAASRSAPRRAMPRSRKRSARRDRPAPWPGRALRTPSLSPSPAIASSAATVLSQAIAAGSSGSARSSTRRPTDESGTRGAPHPTV